MEITIQSPKQKFYQHLSIQNNCRVLFSGKFGTGKSYFLKKYFEGSSKHNLFWISPINYVVGANQDIFEWIKIDIAKEIITKYLPPPQDHQISKNFLIQFHLYKNAGSLFEKLIVTLVDSYIKNETGLPLLDTFKKSIEEYRKFEQEAIEDSKPIFLKLQSYLNTAFQVRGSIYEDDIITQVLRVALETVKLETNRDNYIIIDDLDRLDPEHIFRILNILSAHNDHFDSNKFGFDKVILCCDNDNILNLYKHKYGMNADFEGYIEKFFTYEPFYFSNKDSIINFCQAEMDIFDLKSTTKDVLSLLLICLFNHDKLKIRNLKKIYQVPKSELNLSQPVRTYEITFPEYRNAHVSIDRTILNSNYIEVNFEEFDFIQGLLLLSIALGGAENLRRALTELLNQKVGNETFNSKYLPSLFGSVCIISHIANKFSNDFRESFYSFYNSGDENFINAQIEAPKATFFEIDFFLTLKWNFRNRYTSGSYFENCNPIAGIAQFKDEASRKRVSNFANLIEAVIPIIDFLMKFNFLDNIPEKYLNNPTPHN